MCPFHGRREGAFRASWGRAGVVGHAGDGVDFATSVPATPALVGVPMFKRQRVYMQQDDRQRSDSPLPAEEQAIVEDHLPMRSPMVYEVVRQEGESELRRPLASLWWSGTAAGIAIAAVSAAALPRSAILRPR